MHFEQARSEKREAESADGQPSLSQEVRPFSAEAIAISNYFYEAMPGATELRCIERYESKQLFLPYNAYRETIRDELGWRLEHLESWLFHGGFCTPPTQSEQPWMKSMVAFQVAT